jgi:hypothetical protein
MRVLFLLCVLGGFLAACKSPVAAVSPELGPEQERARKLYVGKCAKCHKLYDPAKYSDAEWQSWMLKMGRKAKLTQEQQRELSQYIEEVLRHPARL